MPKVLTIEVFYVKLNHGLGVQLPNVMLMSWVTESQN